MAVTRRPPSVGDQSPYALVREHYQLPQKRELVVSEVKRILDVGGVQKLTIQIGAPISVERMVLKAELDPTIEQIEVEDLFKLARNTTMKDFTSVGDPMRTVFHAFSDMYKDGAVVTAFLYNDGVQVRRWLNLPGNFDISTLFGIETHMSDELPEDVLLMVGSDPSNPDVVVLSYRIAMDVPKEKIE